MANFSLFSKKAQEEAVGFVAIVVLVVVILVIFLGIFLRNDNSSNMKSSKDLEHFLQSVMSYTTSCSIDYEPNYASLSTLIRKCNQGLSLCTSGQKPCDVAKSTLNSILNASFLIGPDSPRSGYVLKILVPTSQNNTRELMSFSQGECLFRYQGAQYFTASPQGGSIIADFKLCYSKTS